MCTTGLNFPEIGEIRVLGTIVDSTEAAVMIRKVRHMWVDSEYGHGRNFYMMSPGLQRLANTWFLPFTLLIMSPVIIYEKWKERQDAAELEPAHDI